ncbi:MAG: hypothetical protein WB660_20335 [Candidatus Sulfotelmatobacter sp.]
MAVPKSALFLLTLSFLYLLFLTGCGVSAVPSPQPPAAPQAASFEVTITAPPAGAGTVTSSPPGISCPATCTASFPQNTQVKLTATPGSNYFFEGWSGGCSGASPCSLTVTAATTVAAAFTPGDALTVTMAGTGSGTVTSTPTGINCPSTCYATFPQNTEVTLTQTPSANNSFTSWTGACTGSATCTLTLSAADSVTANFTAASTGTGSSSVAFVYVSSNAGGNNNRINAFSAASDGTLAPVPGSPFSANGQAMAANAKYLFGTDGVDIYSFSIASDGALTQVSSINAQQFNGEGQCGGGPYALFLDHSGATLYDVDGNGCSNTAYQSFSVEGSTGALNYLGITSDQSPTLEFLLSFIGNNSYAYSSSCYHLYPLIFGFKRNSDQTLTRLNITPPFPAPPARDAFCPTLAAADPANHLAIPLTPMNIYSMQPDGPAELAVYTADSSGNLTTNSTVANMPQIATNGITALAMSPSGNFLAVAGTGLQVFHFNKANPITPFTGLLTSDQIDQILWDNSNYLYAISISANKLFVFIVTANNAAQAPGSPYTITSPQNIAVVPQM